MEKLEIIIERLKKQKPGQWVKGHERKLPHAALGGSPGYEIVRFMTQIKSKDYSLERRTKLTLTSYDVWDSWDCRYDTRYDYEPDPKSIMYELTVSRTISSGGTSVSEEIEYRNNDLLRELFDHINDIVD